MPATISEITSSYAFSNNSASSPSATWGSGRSTSNTGNLLMAFVYSVVTGTNSNSYSVTDNSGSGSWTAITTGHYLAGGCSVWYKYATSSDSSSTTVTASVSGSPTSASISLYEVKAPVSSSTYLVDTVLGPTGETSSTYCILALGATIAAKFGSLCLAFFGGNASLGSLSSSTMTLYASVPYTHTSLSSTPSLLAATYALGDAPNCYGGVAFENWTTSRTGIGVVVSISAGTFTESGTPISEIATDSTNSDLTTDSQTGAAISEIATDSTSSDSTTDSQTGTSIVASLADVSNKLTETGTLQGQTIALTQDVAPGVPLSSVSASTSTVVAAVVVSGYGLSLSQLKPGSVRGSVSTPSVSGDILSPSVNGKCLAPSVEGSLEVAA